MGFQPFVLVARVHRTEGRFVGTIAGKKWVPAKNGLARARLVKQNSSIETIQ